MAVWYVGLQYLLDGRCRRAIQVYFGTWEDLSGVQITPYILLLFSFILNSLYTSQVPKFPKGNKKRRWRCDTALGTFGERVLLWDLAANTTSFRIFNATNHAGFAVLRQLRYERITVPFCVEFFPLFHVPDGSNFCTNLTITNSVSSTVLLAGA
jgi:hypothetical protein